MQRSTHSRRVLLALLVGLMAAPLLAEGEPDPFSPRAIRDELRPVYEALLADKEYQALKADLDEDPENQEKLERYLRKLPASPMTLLQLDMEIFYYEYVVPKFMMNLHGQWIELNEERARALYGDEHVDQWLFEVKEDADTGKPVPQKISWVGTNRNVAATFPTTPDDYQGEIQLMVNPNNPKQMVAAANTWDSMNGTCGDGIQAVFYSSDGGASWGYTCPPDDSGYTGMSCTWPYLFGSDPAIAWNDNDEVFLNYMLLCMSSSGTVRYSMVVAKSTNGGANWTGQGVIKNSWSTSDIEDKNFYIIDNTSTSPYYDRHYTCWDRNNDEKVAYSTDGGATWTEVDLPTTTGSGSGTRYDLGCDLAVGSNGDVHIVFDTLSCTSSCNNEEMFYTRSTDGGATWSTPVEVRDFTLVAFGTGTSQNAQNDRGIGPFGGIAIDNSGGTCDGTLYAFFSDTTSNANNSDVFVSRSTNNGVTWNAPVKVNDDGLSNRIQFHPFAQVDQTRGHLVIGWHDARNDSANRAIDFYLARSTDCGVTFEDNIQVSQPTSEFNNNAISSSNENSASNSGYNPNQYGEYLGLDTINCRAYMAWTDTRHYFPSSSAPSSFQKENLGFAVIDLDCPSVCGPGSCILGEFCDSCGCYDADSDISRAFCHCGLLDPSCGIGQCIGDGYCDGPHCPSSGVCWAPFTPQSQVMCGGASLDEDCNLVKNDCGPGYCNMDGSFCDACTCFPPGSNISKLFCQCGLLDPTCGLGECVGTNYCEGPHCAAPVCYISTVPMSMGMCGGFELDASCNPY